jgi:O-Antigen ligase
MRPPNVTSQSEAHRVGRSAADDAEGEAAWGAAARMWGRWVPLGLALAVFLVWAARDGGYAAVEWLPGAIFVLGLAFVVALGEWPPFAGSRPLAIAALFLAGFTVWSFLSIAWADVRGDAWDGANRTLLYLCVFVLFAWRPIPARVVTVLLGGFVAVTAAIGAVDFLRAVHADHVEGFFIQGRLSTPITYPNANAALLLAPFAPAVFLASRRSVPVIVRGLMLACAGVLLELAVMCQSRGSLGAFPLTILLFLAISPGRLRLLPALGAVAVALALGGSRLLDVYTAVLNERGVHAALTQARSVLIWTAVALFAVGLAIALVDRRLRLPAPATRAIGWAVVIVAAVAVVSAAFVAVDRYGDPADRAAAAWRQFRAAKDETSSNHLVSGFGSPRYDLWRVALHEFRTAPIIGVGVDNFAVDYLRLRRTKDEPTHQHSLELRVLAQTGLIGAVLFGGFLAAAIAAAVRPLRRRTVEVGGLAAACLAVFAYWCIHGSIDWFWEVPALGAPALAWLAVGAQIVQGEPPPSRRRISPFLSVPIGMAVVVAAAGLALPWVAAKEIDTAANSWAADPAGAFHRLDVARRLNPLTDRADIVAGVIASRLHESGKERAEFLRALERNPRNWYAHFELALLDAQAGKKASALVQLRAVRRLNPREPLTSEIRDEVLRGRRISQEEINRIFVARTYILTGARQR